MIGKQYTIVYSTNHKGHIKPVTKQCYCCGKVRRIYCDLNNGYEGFCKKCLTRIIKTNY